jgi:Bacterial type II/III secretion system short domain
MKRCRSVEVAAIAFFVGLPFPETCRAQNLGEEAKPPRYVSLALVRADAIKAAKRLTFLLGPDADIVADEETNTVFIRANADKIKKARDFLKRQDVPSFLYIIPLRNAESVKTAKKLNIVLTLFWLLGDDRDFHVISLDRENKISIYAGAEKTTQVNAIIRLLDEKPKHPTCPNPCRT